MIAHHRRFSLMGTVITISLYHEQGEKLLDQAYHLLHHYKQRFSANDNDSELMAINHAAGRTAVPVHPELYNLIKQGKAHSCAAGSQLNIAIGALVQHWRIGFKEAKVPKPEEIDQLLPLCQPEDIILDDKEQSVYLAKTGMQLDLGAIAKGYIADQLLIFFKANGARAGLINLGGTIVTFGPALHHDDGLWRVGIRQPDKPLHYNALVLTVRDCAIVTSGIYERRLIDKDHTYHHLLDPQTGYPITSQMASLTILADNSLSGDIWSSRLFGKSHQTILKEIERQSNKTMITIDTNNHCWLSPSLKTKIVFITPQLTVS